MEGSQERSRGTKAGKGKTMMERTFHTSNLTCIMERALPPQPRATINQDAVDAMDQCVTKFAAIVITEATKQRKKERREVMSVNDLMKAMAKLGYDHYVGPLTEYLRRYRESKGTVGRGGRKLAKDAAAPVMGEMVPQPPYDFIGPTQVLQAAALIGEVSTTPPCPSDLTLGMPLYNFIVRDPAPATAVAVARREMSPQPSDFTFVPPLYDFMAQGLSASDLVGSATGEMPPTPPHPSDFTLGLPIYEVTVRGMMPLARGELGPNTGMLALWSGAEAAASTSRMPPAGDDE